MARETRSHARVETCEGPSPTVMHAVFSDASFLGLLGPEESKRRFFSSASDGEGQGFPPPYGERGLFSIRSAGALGCHTRIRAGFPRECWIARARTMARDRPSPYGERGVFSVVCDRLITNGQDSAPGGLSYTEL